MADYSKEQFDKFKIVRKFRNTEQKIKKLKEKLQDASDEQKKKIHQKIGKLKDKKENLRSKLKEYISEK